MNSMKQLLRQQVEGNCSNNNFFVVKRVLERRQNNNLNNRHVSTALLFNKTYNHLLIYNLKQIDYFDLYRRSI